MKGYSLRGPALLLTVAFVLIGGSPISPSTDALAQTASDPISEVLGEQANTPKRCTCPTKPTLEEALDKSSLVFVGQVKDLTVSPLKPDFSQVKFSVNRKLKGFDEVAGNSVLVYSPKTLEACGIPFTEGMDYLVFANGNPAFFQTTSCSLTDVLDRVLVEVHRLIRMTASTE